MKPTKHRLEKLNWLRREVYKQRDLKKESRGRWDPVKEKIIGEMGDVKVEFKPDDILFLIDALEGAYLILESNPKAFEWFDEYFKFEVES